MLYALNHLPSVRNVVVCGHTDCGAMAALADFAHGELEPGLEWWSAQVEPMLNRALSMGDEPVLVQALVEANIQFQVEGLCDYEVVRKRLRKGTLTIYGLLYDVADGSLRQLVSVQSTEPLPSYTL